MFFDNDLIVVYFVFILYYGKNVREKTNWMISLSKLKMGHKLTEKTLQFNKALLRTINECMVQWWFKLKRSAKEVRAWTPTSGAQCKVTGSWQWPTKSNHWSRSMRACQHMAHSVIIWHLMLSAKVKTFNKQMFSWADQKQKLKQNQKAKTCFSELLSSFILGNKNHFLIRPHHIKYIYIYIYSLYLTTVTKCTIKRSWSLFDGLCHSSEKSAQQISEMGHKRKPPCWNWPTERPQIFPMRHLIALHASAQKLEVLHCTVLGSYSAHLPLLQPTITSAIVLTTCWKENPWTTKQKTENTFQEVFKSQSLDFYVTGWRNLFLMGIFESETSLVYLVSPRLNKATVRPCVKKDLRFTVLKFL